MSIIKHKPLYSTFIKEKTIIQLYEVTLYLTEYKPTKEGLEPNKYRVWYNHTLETKKIDEMDYDYQPTVPKTAMEVLDDHQKKS